MKTKHYVDQQAASALDRDLGAATHSDSAVESMRRALSSRILMACLFWLLCLTLTALGHRVYKATVALDREVSASRYQTNGVPIAWIGYGSADEAYKRFVGTEEVVVDPPRLFVLPNSYFWVSAATCLTIVAGLMAWSGRWIVNDGLQSLVGLLAGHALWLGAVEFGLDAAGRRLGLAGSMEFVEGRVVGTHGGGILIQLSAVFLIPMLIGLTIHESNRCAMFQWFRKRLPITRTAAASGRVDNYAARTTIQYFMTVWFCYVSVLWLADPRLGRIGELALWLTMLAILVATPYMIWRTACQSSNAQALRYSVSGAVVTWTAIEIAAAMNFFEEPWLSNSLSSAAVLLALSVLLMGLVVRVLFSSRWGTLPSPSHASLALAVLVAGTIGCARSDQIEPLTAENVKLQLQEYEERIQGLESGTHEGLLHALSSQDPDMRAQAAIALGKSSRVSSVVKVQLETMAVKDDSRLAQFAALAALSRLDVLSANHRRLLRELGEDPVWGPVARSIRE